MDFHELLPNLKKTRKYTTFRYLFLFPRHQADCLNVARLFNKKPIQQFNIHISPRFQCDKSYHESFYLEFQVPDIHGAGHFSSRMLLLSRQVVSDSLGPHGL